LRDLLATRECFVVQRTRCLQSDSTGVLLFNSLALVREHSIETLMDFAGAFGIVKSIKLLTPNGRGSAGL
jgi:hypothetical protein